MKYNTQMNEIYKSIMEDKLPESNNEKIVKIKNEGYRNVMAAHAKIMNEDYIDAVKGRISKLSEASDSEEVKQYLEGIKIFAEQNGFLTPDHNRALVKIEKEFISEKND